MAAHREISSKIQVHRYKNLIVGAGAAGMNCAVHLYEMLRDRGVRRAERQIAVITAGVGLGASRMSGSDKQTYYKLGTSADVPDSAASFAQSLTAAGCVHHDLALAEAIGSLREFYHLVQAGVPFPHDVLGSYIGYKTDHDPYQRATSAGPRTSMFMSQCLEKQARSYGVTIHDRQEVVRLIAVDKGRRRRIAGVLTLDADSGRFNLFCCENLVLAAGGPGELFKTSVYPQGQVGIHGLAFEAGLAAENVTESQFGLASTKFRWNVSGTYMQVIPRIFSTDADGKNPRDFLAGFFPTMRKMASTIFLKGYQWPFDPQRISDGGSSLIDVLVYNENCRGRRVFLDFRKNPVGSAGMKRFDLTDLDPEAGDYLQAAGARQKTPIARLEHMNPLAIDIYSEHGIDIRCEPLEIAVCAQHNNGGFAVNHWWESNIPRTFVIGEMAGTHGVKRPGGSALNAGQTGGLRAATRIAHVYAHRPADDVAAAVKAEATAYVKSLLASPSAQALDARAVLGDIRARMTHAGGHIRQLDTARKALGESLALCGRVRSCGFRQRGRSDLIAAVQAGHLAVTSAAYLAAIVDMLERGGGSRGSHLVLSDDGIEIHRLVCDETGRPLLYKPENEHLRNVIQQIVYASARKERFVCRTIKPRPAGTSPASFEVAWNAYRKGEVYEE